MAARGIKIARRLGQADVVANFGAGLAFNKVQLAQLPEVEEAAARAIDDAQRYGPAGVEAMSRAALLIAAQANPDRSVLRQRFRELKACELPGFSWWRRAVLTTLVRGSALLGEPEPAPELLADPQDAMAPLRYADAALVAAASGNAEIALQLLDDGTRIAHQQQARGQGAMLEVTRGEILLTGGYVDASEKYFHTSHETFKHLGMALQTGRARAGLARIADQRQQRAQPLILLTNREREIAREIARGLTNQQIADLFSISRRTVENHTANIMKKLGASFRHGIIAILHRGNDDQHH